MYISVVTLPVDDMERAIEFYTRLLGWEKTMDAPMEQGRWVTVAPREGQAAFSLHPRDADRAPGFTGVVIEVEDVGESFAAFSKAGVAFVETPKRHPWGDWAMFSDSEGNVHGLHSPPPRAPKIV